MNPTAYIIVVASWCSCGPIFAIEGIDEDSALFQYKTGSMENLTAPLKKVCSGRECCCHNEFGLVSGYGQYTVELLKKEDELVSYNVVLDEQGSAMGRRASHVEPLVDQEGHYVEVNAHAAEQCKEEVKGFIKGTIDEHKPCCIYVGPTGNKWARKGCNSLEGTSEIQKIVGDCAKCPQVPGPHDDWCPAHKMDQHGGKPVFPTMFWETASYEWAQFIATDEKCGGEVFLLLPNANDIDNVDKKISTRIELESYKAMENPPKVTLATDGTCEKLSNYYCTSTVFRDIIRVLKAHDKIFCAQNVKMDQVINLKSLHATMEHEITAFSCSASAHTNSPHKLAVRGTDNCDTMMCEVFRFLWDHTFGWIMKLFSH